MDNFKKVVNMTTAIVFVAAFLLGYGVSSRIINRDRARENNAQETAQNTLGYEEEIDAASSLAQISEAIMGDSTAIITADDQPAGDAVAVAAKIAQAGWIAVHEDAGGKSGNILGAQFFPKGDHLGKITLLRETEAGKKYYIMLHADNGLPTQAGDRAFDYKQDMPIKNATGEPITDAFMAIGGTTAQ